MTLFEYSIDAESESGETVTKSSEIELIVQEILEDMTLREKVSLASLKENEILHYHELFDTIVSEHLGQADEIGKDVIHRIWEVLQETHRIKCLK